MASVFNYWFLKKHVNCQINYSSHSPIIAGSFSQFWNYVKSTKDDNVRYFHESFSYGSLLSRTWTQCGNYRKSLSYFFCRNFVKPTFLLKKSQKSWFDENLAARVNFSPWCVKTFVPTWKIFREINLHNDLLLMEFITRNLSLRMVKRIANLFSHHIFGKKSVKLHFFFHHT